MDNQPGLIARDKGNLLIVTGNRGSGKTTLCQMVVDAALGLGWTAGGVMSPGVFEGSRKTAIEALDLRTGERRLLARRDEQTPAELRTKEWIFDPAALAWGDEALRKAAPADLLVVDELGPLELERGQGWQGGIAALDAGEYRLALAVVRPELLAAARARWPHARVLTIFSANQAPSLAKSLEREMGGI